MPPPNPPRPNYGGEKGKSGGQKNKNCVALSLAIRDGEQASEIGEEFNSGDNCIYPAERGEASHQVTNRLDSSWAVISRPRSRFRRRRRRCIVLLRQPVFRRRRRRRPFPRNGVAGVM